MKNLIALFAALLMVSGCASVDGGIKKYPTREDPRAYKLSVSGLLFPSSAAELIRAQDDYKREFLYGYFPYGGYGGFNATQQDWDARDRRDSIPADVQLPSGVVGPTAKDAAQDVEIGKLKEDVDATVEFVGKTHPKKKGGK